MMGNALIWCNHAVLGVGLPQRKWPKLQDITGGFAYMRLHGDKQLYASGYSDTALGRLGAADPLWTKGQQPRSSEYRASHRPPPSRKSRDIYCYFDNDIKVEAPFDARKLRDRLE